MNVVLAAMMSVAARVIVRGYIISSLPCGEEKSQNPSHALLEIIADNLSKAGFSWGCSLAIDSNVANGLDADAHRSDGKRFVVHADDRLTVFVELESAVRGFSQFHGPTHC